MNLSTCCAALLVLAGAPAMAQTATPAPVAASAAAATSTPATAAPAAAAAKFTLDSPIETLVADMTAKKVLDDDLPGLTTNDKYDMFKSMSLNQVAGFAPDKLTPERLTKVATDLAAIQ
ncbi:MAG: hypothetical protein WC804_09580 [Sphingomonas sp.]|jgi:hypothetical protein|uniref:hypothetical protein n=1 Tax=Sphingomonas sp. TaxID=28214 RepID=UPI0035632FBD